MGQNKDALLKFCTPLKTNADNSKMIKCVERSRSLTTDIVVPNDITPMPEKLLGDFFVINK